MQGVMAMQTKTLTIQLNDEQLPILPVCLLYTSDAADEL